MNSKTMFLAVVVSASLVGCQHMHGTGRMPPPWAQKSPCSTQQCEVKVTVENCVVKVEPEVLDVSQGRDIQDITWKLYTDRYDFSRDPLKYAIVLKSNDAAGQLHNPSHGAQSITVKFRHKTPGTWFQYGVNVVRSDGERCSTKDPWVWE
jgi:hypothetical protein